VKIAIVGNSPKVLEQDHGDFIDSHDLIVRCNKGSYKGYEKYIGSRTDCRVINIHIAMLLSDFDTMIKDKHFTDLFSDWKDKKPEDFIDKNERVVLKDSVNFTYDIEHIDYSKESSSFAEKHNLTGGLSVGGCAILFCCDKFEYDSINCFGFSFYKDTNTCSHYFETVNNKIISHDHEKEYEIVSKFNGVKFL